MASSSDGASFDFTALLSRNYKPSRIAQIQVQSVLDTPVAPPSKKSRNKKKKKEDGSGSNGGGATTIGGGKKDAKTVGGGGSSLAAVKRGPGRGGGGSDSGGRGSSTDDEGLSSSRGGGETIDGEDEEEEDVVYYLVEDDDDDDDEDSDASGESSNSSSSVPAITTSSSSGSGSDGGNGEGGDDDDEDRSSHGGRFSSSSSKPAQERKKWERYLRTDLDEAMDASLRSQQRRLANERLVTELRNRYVEERCIDMVDRLLPKTEYYRTQVGEDDDDEEDDDDSSSDNDAAVDAYTRMMSAAAGAGGGGMTSSSTTTESLLLRQPALHEIEQSNWESRIAWGDDDDDDDNRYYDNGWPSPPPRRNTKARMQQKATGGSATTDDNYENPQDILDRGYNHALQSMDFTNLISWEGSDAPPGYNLSLAESMPLVLAEGIAGSSVVRNAVPPKRPTPLSRNEVYIQRVEMEMNSDGGSSLGMLGAFNEEKMAEIIAQRQRKRALMAIDKSKRVTEAMGTLDLGGGKGRAITSSLMGPGGTERTGRPTKHVGSSMAYDAELVEHLDLVYNHTLVRPDLKKSELRQFHRPRLPKTVVRVDRPWQLQVRAASFAGTKNKGASTTAADGSTLVAGSASSMMGTHPGAISQSKIRNEADLSPTEGLLVLLEYCEERPPIQLSKGMACKIVNYYRGDRAKCPVSRGGGARPPKKRAVKKEDENNTEETNDKSDRPRLVGPDTFDVSQIGKLIGVKKKGKKKDEGKGIDGEDGGEKKKASSPTTDILPEGTTEILPPKLHGPFIGSVDEGSTQSGLISNLFAAPIFRHEPEQSDFLLILGKKPSGSHHRHRMSSPSEPFGVMLRELPTSVYTVGQTEPKVKVFAPNTTGEKNFTAPFVTYQIAKALTMTEKNEGRGLRFDEINDRLFANTDLLPNALRQRIKQVAIYDKNTQIWTSKEIGFEEYPGVDSLGRRFSPEGVAAYESACAYVRRLHDLGITDLHSGSSGVQSVGQAMVYINGAVNAARLRRTKVTKVAAVAKNSKNREQAAQAAKYEEAAAKLDAEWKEQRRRLDVARFIYEELQLAPWSVTQEFIDIHKNAQGTAMMKLTGLGDPSGRGEGYNFLREQDTKPNKLTGNTDGALNAQIKKITGTENDLRKLTMKQMASLLRSYGMGQKQIDTLKRWDRVHCIRDLSTKAASDGMGDGMERYARGEKMKLSDQKQMYRDRIQEIWKRQRAALATDAGTFDPAFQKKKSSAAAAAAAGGSSAVASGGESGGAAKSSSAAAAVEENKKQDDDDMDDSDSESDDDFAADLEDDMMGVRETNLLVADHVRGGTNEMGSVVGGEDVKDARELAALKRQREEERLAQEGLLSRDGRSRMDLDAGGSGMMRMNAQHVNRKVIRKRVTRTHPDGSQTVNFEFIVRQDDVEEILSKKKEAEKAAKEGKKKGLSINRAADRKKKGLKGKVEKKDWNHDSGELVGHAMFEEEDDYVKPKIQLSRTVKEVVKKKKTGGGRVAGVSKTGGAPKKTSASTPSSTKPPKTMKKAKATLAKSKEKIQKEKKMKKRRREEDDAELYSAAPHRKGTSNRRERGAARHRMPHVIMANKLEDIRALVERRPNSGPFHRPVDRRLVPRYYEVISDPIDLQTIRDKNKRYEYKTVDSFVRDFELMKNNAIKFNGVGSILGNEATDIYEFVKSTADTMREDFTKMEQAVQDQLSGNGGRKKSKKSSSPSPAKSEEGSTGGNTDSVAGGSVVAPHDVSVDGVTTTLDLQSIPTNFSFDAGDDTDSDDSGEIV